MRLNRETTETSESSRQAHDQIRATRIGVRLALRRLLAIGVLTLVVLLASCAPSGMSYYQGFTYPTGGNPLGPWQPGHYVMDVNVYWDSGSYNAPSEKTAHVSISDKESHLLDDDLQLGRVRGVEVTSTWQDFSNVTVGFYETGYPYEPRDAYNQQLLKSGPRLLKKITYRYDSRTRKFKRVSSQPPS